MSERLNKTVVVGGVLYPAGTAATAELLEKIPSAAHWDGAEIDDEKDDSPLSGDHPNTLLLREVCEHLIAGHLADVETPVAVLVADVQDTFGFVTEPVAVAPAADPVADVTKVAGDDGDDGDDGAAGVPVAVDYSVLDVDALKAEIDKRNEGRDDDSKLSKRGGQETLAAALKADDEV